MIAKLYREDAETRDTDIFYSVVGPGHYRAYFTLIAIAGYAGEKLPTHTSPYYAAPFHIYSMAGESFPKRYKTQAAAKRAVRKIIKGFLEACPKEISWEAEDSGVHWTGKANGVQIANYYYCPEEKGNWHKGFTVWFGGTYYLTRFANPEEAREAVSHTFTTWLDHARKCLLK